jgi:hypothetical protein
MLRPLGTILVRQADGSRFLTFGFKRNKMFSSAIGRSGAHRRKLRTTFGYVAYFWIAIRSIDVIPMKK